MKKLKFMQNSICNESFKIAGSKIPVPVRIVTTMKRLEVYAKGKLIASAGVVNENDFDYQSLLAFAQEKSGSKLAL